MTVAIGLDLSLTSTGLAGVVDGRLIAVGNVKSSGTNADRYPEHLVRIKNLWQDIDQWVHEVTTAYGKPDVALIESPSFKSRNGKPHERAGLWWKVYENLWLQDITICAIAPTTRAKYITGKGRVEKAEVLDWAQRQYGEFVSNHDIADAAGMAAMGSRALGVVAEAHELPDGALKSFEGVPWPTLLAA